MLLIEKCYVSQHRMVVAAASRSIRFFSLKRNKKVLKALLRRPEVASKGFVPPGESVRTKSQKSRCS